MYFPFIGLNYQLVSNRFSWGEPPPLYEALVYGYITALT